VPMSKNKIIVSAAALIFPLANIDQPFRSFSPRNLISSSPEDHSCSLQKIFEPILHLNLGATNYISHLETAISERLFFIRLFYPLSPAQDHPRCPIKKEFRLIKKDSGPLKHWNIQLVFSNNPFTIKNHGCRDK